MKPNAWQIMKLQPDEMNIGEFLRITSPEISQIQELDLPQQTLLVLLVAVTSRPQTWLLAHPEAELTTSEQDELQRLLKRLKKGEPLAYLIGRQEFFGLSFEVTPAVLIPRPETELLVETALTWLKAHPAAHSALDVGTGSGCIAISLAVNLPSLSFVATDVSLEALAVARGNAKRQHVEERITFQQTDLIPPDFGQFDLICANLPYVPTEHLQEVNSLAYEPVRALDGGADGLTIIRHCLEMAQNHIHTPGLLLFEIEASTSEEASALARKVIPQASISLKRDLANRDRLLSIELEP